MKSSALLVILTLTMNIAYANEEPVIAADDVAAYCEEQAQLAGIEDAAEKSQHVQDCVASFTSQSEGAPQTDQE